MYKINTVLKACELIGNWHYSLNYLLTNQNWELNSAIVWKLLVYTVYYSHKVEEMENYLNQFSYAHINDFKN